MNKSDSINLDRFYSKLETLPLFSQQRGIYLDSVLMILPNNAYAWQQKAMPLFKQKKYEIAQPFLDSAVKYNPKRYLDYSAFLKCIFSKKYTESISTFKKAQQLNGNSIIMDHPYSFYIGLSYLQLNKLDSAQVYLNQTINYEKEKRKDESWIHFLHWFYLGVIHFEKDQFEEAIKCFDKTLATYSQFSDAKYYKAICLESLNKKKEAFDLHKEALENFKQGYTINEDNAIYEAYPYQVNRFYIEAYIQRMEEEKN